MNYVKFKIDPQAETDQLDDPGAPRKAGVEMSSVTG